MIEIRSVERTAAAIIPRRGALAGLAGALEASFGLTLPAVGCWEGTADLRLVRTAPHQVLALRDGAGEGMVDELDAALGAHAGVVDLSDARAAVRVEGPRARDALARLLPLDLHPRAMQCGNAAATLAAHMSVLVLQLDDAPSYELLFQCSFAGSLLRALGIVRECEG